MGVEGRTAIVTGGAQGIGRGIVERLASEGANVMIGDLNADGAASVAEESAGRVSKSTHSRSTSASERRRKS